MEADDLGTHVVKYRGGAQGVRPMRSRLDVPATVDEHGVFSEYRRLT
jgi:hypothetical protein